METFWAAGARALILIAALSLDAWAASFAYGAGKIRIPFFSLLVIDAICSVSLGASMLAGDLLGPLLPAGAASALSFWMMLALGLVKLFDSSLKNWIRRKSHRTIRLRFLGADLILQIYADATLADRDASRVLSPGEAASLALALSLDGLAAGVGAGMGAIPLWTAVGLSALIHGAAIWLGASAGKRCSRHIKGDPAWLGGLLLILLAFFRA